jgi:hypothetical protein
MRTTALGAAGLMVLLGITCPAFAEKATDADNTAQNKGATQNEAVTADKQGNSKLEVTVLADVRKAILAESGLSTNAQNAKILYGKDGTLKLRGPVDTDAEKTRLEEIAKGVSGVKAVKNMLTVTAKKEKTK